MNFLFAFDPILLKYGAARIIPLDAVNPASEASISPNVKLATGYDLEGKPSSEQSSAKSTALYPTTVEKIIACDCFFIARMTG